MAADEKGQELNWILAHNEKGFCDVVHTYACASVCAHVCVSVIREIKNPFLG